MSWSVFCNKGTGKASLDEQNEDVRQQDPEERTGIDKRRNENCKSNEKKKKKKKKIGLLISWYVIT